MDLNRRLAKELQEARGCRGVRELRPLGGGLLCWEGLLLPEQPPYSAGAFRFELRFSPRHPLAPPRVTLRTPIRHPAVGADGRVCQPLTSPERWAPHVTALQVLEELLLLLETPGAAGALRPELARELAAEPRRFGQRAEEHARRHAERRPQ
ncbi:ubiquitin-conjugating enzyme E2 L3-like [Nothoprocta perdicaria]|uniref:ubiquitin-conjugating enzyme E2 L3-like n=1 Tax=Nothoprocta perdicaria TaxID=30464 RepID=UPI000E1BFD2C|nr:ubiquitin-conjugating enzyme E2 L3-like [Nothoprocta perdicaria]